MAVGGLGESPQPEQGERDGGCIGGDVTGPGGSERDAQGDHEAKHPGDQLARPGRAVLRSWSSFPWVDDLHVRQ